MSIFNTKKIADEFIKELKKSLPDARKTVRELLEDKYSEIEPFLNIPGGISLVYETVNKVLKKYGMEINFPTFKSLLKEVVEKQNKKNKRENAEKEEIQSANSKNEKGNGKRERKEKGKPIPKAIAKTNG